MPEQDENHEAKSSPDNEPFPGIFRVLRYSFQRATVELVRSFYSLAALSVAFLLTTYLFPNLYGEFRSIVSRVVGVEIVASPSPHDELPTRPPVQSEGPPKRAASAQESNLQLLALEARIVNIERNQKAIATALADDPERALSVPLLRRDLENLKDTTSQQVQETRAQADRLYDIVKWIIGATVFGVISLLISGIISRIFNK